MFAQSSPPLTYSDLRQVVIGTRRWSTIEFSGWQAIASFAPLLKEKRNAGKDALVANPPRPFGGMGRDPGPLSPKANHLSIGFQGLVSVEQNPGTATRCIPAESLRTCITQINLEKAELQRTGGSPSLSGDRTWEANNG